MPDPLESFGQYGLDHSSDEGQYREAVVLDLAGFVVAIPEADGFAIISFDSSDRDRGDTKYLARYCANPLAWAGTSPFSTKATNPLGYFFHALSMSRWIWGSSGICFLSIVRR